MEKKNESMGELNLELMQYYIFEWIKSQPVDTTITLNNCWGEDYNNMTAFTLDPDVTFKKVLQHNIEADNNLCFSRILPLTLWGHCLKEDEELYEAVKLVCYFSHTTLL